MEPFIGQIILFSGNFAPRGWAFCDGQLLPISNYQALFSILGTRYGGDGETTFGLPEFRGRRVLHQGSGPGLAPKLMGQQGGNYETVLTQSNMASHTHSTIVTNNLSAHSSSADGEEEEAGDNALGKSTIYAAGNPTEEMRNGSISGDVEVTINTTGVGASFSNEQPYQVLNYIIALEGIFPSR